MRHPSLALLLFISSLISGVFAFAPSAGRVAATTCLHMQFPPSVLSTIVTTTTTLAAEDSVEYAELPAPYIPVLFGLGLVVVRLIRMHGNAKPANQHAHMFLVVSQGVGLLTGSLGDVMDEEAQLGMQSGARAKKEIERSRSSYFKRK